MTDDLVEDYLSLAADKDAAVEVAEHIMYTPTHAMTHISKSAHLLCWPSTAHLLTLPAQLDVM